MGLTQKLGTIPLAILTDSSNNVGIGGAPSGSYKLDVTGTGRFTSNVSIGSVLSTWGSPFNNAVLQLGTGGGFIVGRNDAFNQLQIGSNATYDGTNWLYKSTDYASKYYQAQGTHLFQYAPSGTAGATITWNTALTLASTGAATFSSSVQATSYRANLTSTGGYFQSYDGTDEIDFGSRKSISGSGNSYDAMIYTSNASGAFYVFTGGVYTTPKFSILSSGNVGIGTSPSYKLDIRNDVPSSTSLDPITLRLYNNSDGGSAIYFNNSVSGQSKISFGVESTGSGTDDTYLGFSTGANTALSERMRITSGGNVMVGFSGTLTDTRLYISAIGTTSSNYALVIKQSNNTTTLFNVRDDGQITTALGTGTVTSTSGVLSVVSDMNLKIENGYIDNALDKVLNLKPRYFYWKEESNLPTDLRQLGFYAQEVNKALGEEAANTPKENITWGINDRAIIAMLTKAIQELNQLAQEQQATITSLQDRLTKAGL